MSAKGDLFFFRKLQRKKAIGKKVDEGGDAGVVCLVKLCIVQEHSRALRP
jgi:hypothetical protein